MIRFDTRDKQPKLYGALLLTFAALAAAVLLTLHGTDRNAKAISLVCSAYFAALLVMLIRAAVEQLRYNPYSYNTIYYIGFSLFVLSLLFTLVYLTAQIFVRPEEYRVQEIISAILNSSWFYILLSFPLILVFSAALCISNISLIRHEGKRIVNILGIILSFLMIAGALCLYFFDFISPATERGVMLHDMAANFLSAVYLYYECMLIGSFAAVGITARYEPEPDKDVIIVLGCGLKKDGTPTPLLRGRLDKALEFSRRQLETSGKELCFVTSGGKGSDEHSSESAAMKRYLMEQGVPESKIIEEDRSRDTEENMKFSEEKIRAVFPGAKIAYATTNYHVFRSGIYARGANMRAVGMGASTKWYFWPNAAVREFVGLVLENKGKQACVLLAMVLFYTVFTFFIYSI